MDRKEIIDILKEAYAGIDIAQSEMELLARNIGLDIDSDDLNCIPSTVVRFWSKILWCREHGAKIEDVVSDDSIDFEEGLSNEVDSDTTKDFEIFESVINDLEVNEKNAHALCQSFLDFNNFNAFVRLVTDFRDYLTDSELDEIFEAASCFDDELVDCYRED